MRKEIEVVARWWTDNMFKGDVSEIDCHVKGLGPLTQGQVDNFEKALIQELVNDTHFWKWDLERPGRGALENGRFLSTTFTRGFLSMGISRLIIRAAYRALIPGVMHRMPKHKSTIIYPGKVFLQTTGAVKREVLYEEKVKRTRKKPA